MSQHEVRRVIRTADKTMITILSVIVAVALATDLASFFAPPSARTYSSNTRPADAAGRASSTVTMRSAWEVAVAQNTVEGYKAFLSRYSDREYAGRARAAIDSIQRARSVVADVGRQSRSSGGSAAGSTKPTPSAGSAGAYRKPAAPQPTLADAMDEIRAGRYTQGEKSLKILARNGVAEAQFQLAQLYDQGKGSTSDQAQSMSRSADWCREAANQGHTGAEYSLGLKYLSGAGVQRDLQKAVSWIKKAAFNGHAGAQTSLGTLYATGTGVAKNQAEAVKWYRKAADQGFADGQVNLGIMYQYGLAVNENKEYAVELYRKAAEQGSPTAQYMLGSSLEKGDGVAKDLDRAAYWYSLAANSGSEKAAQALKRLGRPAVPVTTTATAPPRPDHANSRSDATAGTDNLTRYLGVWGESWGGIYHERDISITESHGKPAVDMQGNWTIFDVRLTSDGLTYRKKGGDSNWEFKYTISGQGRDTLQLIVFRVHDSKTFKGKIFR